FGVAGTGVGMLPALGCAAVLASAMCLGLRHDSVARPLFFTSRLLLVLLNGFILFRWFQEAFPPSAAVARLLLFVPWVVGLFFVALQVVYGLLVEPAYLLPLLRRRYLRPTQPLPPRHAPPFPRVTVHIPCHAEPPGVVLATLDAVSRLRYPDFDVIVVDNNTEDPALWRPVEAHCARLGPRFRFVHVESLPGAKGGALNLALRLTPKETRVVALLDADYVCEPDFLERLVGFFDDPAIDYVQTPHDYRGWQGRRFLRGCYWEERTGNVLQLPALSEWGITTLIGTTCLIRRDALEAVGGWSETCLTEDSELALRLEARGGQGLFLARTFGRGLLPETFLALKKQRFRWVAGPIQQLRMHWRGLLPDRSPRMAARHRWARFFQGLEFVSTWVMDLLGLVALLGTLLLAVGRQSIPLPEGLLPLLATNLVTQGVLAWLRGRLLGCSLREVFAVTAISSALGHTRRQAVAAAFFSRRPLLWLRTDKFQATSVGWRAALATTRGELVTGLVMLGLGVLMLSGTDLSRPDLFLLGGAACLAEAWALLCAPYFALTANAELRKGVKARPPALSPGRPAVAAPATAAACRTAAESSPAASPPP
ncbi:glycosyltransferase, partial [Corallococcus carmarthensis]|uniref:glycosyltransferase n=1 Tax=Corallococcus carmarthensis TaxID=2316728 RepID=UPI001ABEFF28